MHPSIEVAGCIPAMLDRAVVDILGCPGIRKCWDQRLARSWFQIFFILSPLFGEDFPI